MSARDDFVNGIADEVLKSIPKRPPIKRIKDPELRRQAKLLHSDQYCPKCGTRAVPTRNGRCDRCYARLIPMKKER